ncbi:hypothetical protein ASE68_00930 [Agromyces sp. Leaf222]|nr:hypothetical protein ASE68_00930 [Agromyces sp. Leaf222]
MAPSPRRTLTSSAASRIANAPEVQTTRRSGEMGDMSTCFRPAGATRRARSVGRPSFSSWSTVHSGASAREPMASGEDLLDILIATLFLIQAG